MATKTDIRSFLDALLYPACLTTDRIEAVNGQFAALFADVVECDAEAFVGRPLVPDFLQELAIGQAATWQRTTSVTGRHLRVAVGGAIGSSEGNPMRVITIDPIDLLGVEPRSPTLGLALEAIDDDRRRVARELHDETGQWLTTLIVGLQGLEGRVDPKTGDELKRLRELTKLTVNEVRRICRGLHPGTLERLGLFSGLGSLADDFSTTHRVATQLELSELREMQRLRPRTELAIFRLVQEALTNVARHADASLVRLEASLTESTLHVSITDDGAGFDPRAIRHSSLGLLGMRERAEQIGGRLHIDSSPGHGTTIDLVVPLDRQNG